MIVGGQESLCRYKYRGGLTYTSDERRKGSGANEESREEVKVCQFVAQTPKISFFFSEENPSTICLCARACALEVFGLLKQMRKRWKIARKTSLNFFSLDSIRIVHTCSGYDFCENRRRVDDVSKEKISFSSNNELNGGSVRIRMIFNHGREIKLRSNSVMAIYGYQHIEPFRGTRISARARASFERSLLRRSTARTGCSQCTYCVKALSAVLG